VPPYSKSKVDKAGRVITDGVAAVMANPDRLGDHAVVEQMKEAMAVIDWWRGEHAKPLTRVAANLRYHAGQEGDPIVAQRLKRAPTIAGKLVREPRMKLSRMADIGGVRAILPDQATAYRVAGRLRRNWTITRVRDYVIEPKDDGYRALHLINRHHGRLIEIQLRTSAQDIWANMVEGLSRTDFPGLKFGGGPPVLREYMSVTAKLIAEVEEGLISAEEAHRLIKAQAAQITGAFQSTNES
jgi:putative GTP pyrophosphokinase